MKQAVIASSFTLLITLLSCGDDSLVSPFIVTLEAKKQDGSVSTSFSLGEPITFVLSITNRTDRSQTIHFGNSQRYNFLISRRDTGELVWEGDACTSFLAIIGQLDFAPKETKSFSEIWDQKIKLSELTSTNCVGPQVDASSYTSLGIITGDLPNPNSNPLTIAII